MCFLPMRLFWYLMTFLLAFISSLLLCPLGQIEQSKNVIAGIVECNELEHDFGQIKASSIPISYTFILKNISGEDIYIQQICTTCSCTTVIWDRHVIHNGEAKSITVTFNKDKEVTKFIKSIIVYLSDLKNPFSLRIKGEIISDE